MRLPRSRKGKTTVDVTVTRQDGLPRVRLSMGERSKPGFKNTDMDESEVEALVTFLQFNLAKVRGQIPWNEGEELPTEVEL